MAQRGRKSKLTPETETKLHAALDMGLSYKHAAQYAGIAESTFWDWMHGKSEFAASINAREGRAALTLMSLVQQAGLDDWHAAAWILEHRWPDEYARNRIEVQHTGGIDLNVLAGVRAAVEHAFPDNPDAPILLADAMAAMETKKLPETKKRRRAS